MIKIGLLGTIAKAVGGAALDATIDTACMNLENFAKSAFNGRRVDWNYDVVVKGKTIASIKIGVLKTRSKIHYFVGSLKLSFDLNKIHPGCVSAVNTFLSLF